MFHKLRVFTAVIIPSFFSENLILLPIFLHSFVFTLSNIFYHFLSDLII